MAIHSLTLQVQVPPPVMLRQRHVVILLRDSQGRYVLGRKKIYPPGITRMVGGGVDKTEPFHIAARREVYEELKYTVSAKDLQELAQVMAHIRDAKGQTWQFQTMIYFAELDRQLLSPGDDLDGIARLSNSEYLSLIQRYKNLPKEIDVQLGFAWYDWGQLYAPIHQIAWESVQHLNRQKRVTI